MNQKILFVLPSYNESLNIPNLLTKIDFLSRQIPYFDVEVLIVNDGSSDDTLKVAENTNTQVKKHILDLQPNRGLAGAVREGFKKSLTLLNDEDIIVVMDADDSHNPLLSERMIKKVNEGFDVVIASRFQKGARVMGLSKFREFTSWCAGLIFRVFKPINGVRDYTCGYRAYRVSFLRKAHEHYKDKFIEEQGFACMAEIILKLSKQGAIFAEVPMVLRYDFKQGESKMNMSKTVQRTLNLIFKRIS